MRPRVSVLPPRLAAVTVFTCPECGYGPMPIQLSPTTFTGQFRCGNVDCRAYYRVVLQVPGSQKSEVKEFRDRALGGIHKLDTIDWTGATFASECVGRFLGP